VKALTIYQPWASLIAVGSKMYETRSWQTDYRGPIAIHAGLKFINDFDEGFAEIAHEKLKARLPGFTFMHKLPRGCVIAIAELSDCWRIIERTGGQIIMISGYNKKLLSSHNEHIFGDFAPGRYAWELTNVKPLPEPVPARGQQGLWEWREAKA